MKFSKIKSHAKINLSLNVVGKKLSLHKIETIVAFIELHDKIMIKDIKSNKHKILFTGKFSKKIGKKNTISKLLKILDKKKLKCVTKLKPTKKDLAEIQFAFNICKHVKSNAIVLCNNFSTIGIGAGQPSRLDSCKIAINKMNKFQKIGANDEIIAASDAFFPFVDGIETLVQAGVTAVIQPSGSIRDKDIIKFADKIGIVLVFSKTRHFKH